MKGVFMSLSCSSESFCKSIEAALHRVETCQDSETQKKSTHYILDQAEKWSKASDGRLTKQDILIGLVRSCGMIHKSSDERKNEPVALKTCVEYPGRVSRISYEVREQDNHLLFRSKFLSGLLMNRSVYPRQEVAGAFLATMANRMILSDTGHKDSLTQKVAKVFVDAVMELPKEKQEGVISCFSMSCWPKEMVSYVDAKRYKQQKMKVVNMPQRQKQYMHNIVYECGRS